MQFFPFAGLAFRIAKSVIEEAVSDPGPSKAAVKGSDAGASDKGEIKSFEEILRDLGADGRKEESASNGEKHRLVVDPRTGRVTLVKEADESGKDGEKGEDGEELILPELQKNGEAARNILRARILKAGGDSDSPSEGDPAGDLKKALRALLSGGEVEIDPDKLKLTKEDFAAIKEALAEFGLSEADIEALEDRIESKAGLTWTAFASALGKLVGENVLSGVREIGGEDAKHLQNFFQKLGFTPQKSASLIKDLKNGEYDKVWREAGARIARMPQGSSVEVKSAELKALSEVMNLSGKSEARLIGLLSGAAGGRIGKREMRLLVATLAQEAAEQGAGGVKKIEALREILAEAFKLARDREEAMKNSDAENDGRTRTYKVLAEESRKSRESGRQSESGGSREGEVASRWLNDKGGGKSADKAESADKAADGEKGEASRARGGQRSEGAAAVKGKTSDGEKAEAERFTTLRESKSEAASNDKGESRSRSYGKDGKDGKDGKEPSADDKRAMREFLAKIGRENAENNAAGREGARIDPNAVADKAAQAAQAQNKAFEVLHQAEQGSPRHILRQVQTGMFRAVSAGRQQLTLRLDPPDLGKVHLMLQVTRNEVNAVIRAENPGAARMVADQLAQIKASLEAQGLRVGKLEVQTQTQQQNPNQQQFAWEGAEQHNQARENGQKSGFLGRWARGGKGGEALAREMQNPQEPARNSREGLDIFA